MKYKRFLLIAIAGTWIPSLTIAQQSITDSADLLVMKGNLIEVYRKAIREQSPLFTGSEYIGYVTRPKGHPYFNSTAMQPGTINYDGVVYHDSILFDLVNGDVLIRNFENSHYVRLVKEKVRYFSIGQHIFLRLDQDDLPDQGMETGFYELLYNGEPMVLVRRTKQLKSEAFREEIRSEYLTHNSYFVRKDSVYHRIFSKESLIKIFDDKKQDVRKFIRDRGLDFKKNPEETLKGVAAYYGLIKK